MFLSLRECIVCMPFVEPVSKNNFSVLLLRFKTPSHEQKQNNMSSQAQC